MSGHALACLQQLRTAGLHHGLLPLLDVVLEQPIGMKFVTLALESTDARVKRRQGRLARLPVRVAAVAPGAGKVERLPRRRRVADPGPAPGRRRRARQPDRVAGPAAPHRHRHARHLGDAAALRTPQRQGAVQAAGAPALPRRLRLPAAALRIRRTRRGAGRLVDRFYDGDAAERERLLTTAAPRAASGAGQKKRPRRRGPRKTGDDGAAADGGEQRRPAPAANDRLHRHRRQPGRRARQRRRTRWPPGRACPATTPAAAPPRCTAPRPSIPSGDDYINAVAAIDTPLDAHAPAGRAARHRTGARPRTALPQRAAHARPRPAAVRRRASSTSAALDRARTRACTSAPSCWRRWPRSRRTLSFPASAAARDLLAGVADQAHRAAGVDTGAAARFAAAPYTDGSVGNAHGFHS